jgi:ADP-heptose:LPS heptosyltransferase
VVNAQYDAAEDELQKLEQLSGRTILRPQGLDQKQELDRTAALFSELDAVLSAPTAVSWLAAAAGTAVFKILYDTSWTSFGRDYEPLAPAAHCIRPRKAGDWPSAFAAAHAALEQHFAAKR